jgi:hypothetical protein
MKATNMADKKEPLDHKRGGFNPRPAESKKRDQVGPAPTSGKEEKKDKKPAPGVRKERTNESE